MWHFVGDVVAAVRRVVGKVVVLRNGLVLVQFGSGSECDFLVARRVVWDDWYRDDDVVS